MNRKKDIFNIKLSPEEQEIENALPDTWEALPFSANQEQELAFAKINIKLTRHDVEGLRRIAIKEGLPYQTLIASILHKYVTQHLEG